MFFCWIFRNSHTYNFPLDSDTLTDLGRKKFSSETVKKMTWVHHMYSNWRDARNATGMEFIACDLEDMSTICTESFLFGMKRFITEIRKLDGTDFPAKTLYQIVICVQFHLESMGLVWKLLDDKEFTELKFTLDNTMKQRVTNGIGINVKKADIISVVEEDILWERGILGSENPEQLLQTILYVVGLNCALHAGKEHRALRSIPFDSQFQWVRDDYYGQYFLRYTEDLGMKTNKGGIKHRKIEAKTVDVYPIQNSYRCPVRIIGFYLSVLPVNRTQNAFYLQPLKNYTPTCWFQDTPVGVNKLQKVVKIIAQKGGLPGFYTNHSLRATTATRLYHNNCDEQLIQEITGHRSVVVRSYKRTCQNQRKVASNCITGFQNENSEPEFKRQKLN